MTVFALDRPWVPLNGKHYGQIVLVPKLETFTRDNPYYWGICNAHDLTYTTTIDRIQIVGDRNWHPRFDVMNKDNPSGNAGDWEWQKQALGGNGANTALSGIHAANAKLHIKHLDVVGLPGAGIIAGNCSPLVIDSAYFDRVGWPISMETYNPSTKVKIGRVATRDHWFGRKWENFEYISADARAVSMRRLEAKVSGRGEITCTGMGWVLDGLTHMGDGLAFKVSGSRWRLRNAQVQAAFFAGTVPDNVTNPAYADPKYQFLKENVDCVAEDCVFGDGPFARQQAEATVYVSWPFAPDPLTLRRCTFVRGWRPHAMQINWGPPEGPSVVADDCDFIGWDSWDQVFQLSPPGTKPPLPGGSVDYSTSRIWAS